MAITLYSDIIEGSGLEHTADGFKVTRIFILDGCTGGPDAVLYQAISSPFVPPRGQFHPTIPGLALSTRRCAPIQNSPSQCMVTLVYEQINWRLIADESKPGECTIGGTVQSISTNVDYFGNPIVVFYNSVDPTTNATTVKYQSGTINVNMPQLICRMSRKEPQNPLQKAKQFLNKFNSAPFLGDDPQMWLCTRIEGTTQDGGETFLVNYEFQLNPGGWLATAVYQDPTNGGQVPADADINIIVNPINIPTMSIQPSPYTSGNGVAQFIVYGGADFNALNLIGTKEMNNPYPVRHQYGRR
jgi:hypothetical protein